MQSLAQFCPRLQIILGLSRVLFTTAGIIFAGTITGVAGYIVNKDFFLGSNANPDMWPFIITLIGAGLLITTALAIAAIALLREIDKIQLKDEIARMGLD